MSDSAERSTPDRPRDPASSSTSDGRAAALDAAPSNNAITAKCWYCMAPGFLYRHADGYNISMCDTCRDAGQADAVPKAPTPQVEALAAYAHA